MEIMKNICDKNKNLAYSPLSIYAALGLLTFGAQGKTLDQLLFFLKKQNLQDLSAFCSQLTKSLNETQASSNSGGPKLSFVNSVWVEQSFALNPQFKEVANSVFKAQAEAVDFRNKPNEERLKVNGWVEGSTNGLIKDLIPEDKIKSETKIVSVNALYFKGSWRTGQFDKSMTKDSEFYLLDGHSSVQVPFMGSGKTYQYISCHKGFKILKLPYQGPKIPMFKLQEPTTNISMYILLPDSRDGLVQLVEMASGSSASFLDQYLLEDPPSVRTRHFKVPKFKITFDFDAKEVLKAMGLVLPFGLAAELNGVVNSNCYVDSVIHKCFVEVDEQGTEAAAATAVMGVAFGCCAPLPPPPPPVDFVADHPFMFMIKDNNTGVLLFTGYVLNPLLTS